MRKLQHLNRKFFVLLVAVITLAGCTAEKGEKNQDKKAREPVPEAVYKTRDSLIFEKIMAHAEAQQWATKSAGKTMALTGKQFIGRPYTAHTLEIQVPEKVVVNLRELDCTTLLENSLALTLTIHQNYGDFNQYLRNLERIRYRKGTLNGYVSRLHYSSDWLYDNEKLGIITPVTQTLDGAKAMHFELNFMSTHPDAYKQLKNNQARIEKIKEQEKKINQRSYPILPQEKIKQNFSKFRQGDIIGFVTNKEGLDIAHVGIVTIKEDEPHLMHASSSADEVIISEKNLAGYMEAVSHITGIVLARINK